MWIIISFISHDAEKVIIVIIFSSIKRLDFARCLVKCQWCLSPERHKGESAVCLLVLGAWDVCLHTVHTRWVTVCTSSSCAHHMNTSAVLVSLLRLHDPISSPVFLPTFLFLTLLYVSTQQLLLPDIMSCVEQKGSRYQVRIPTAWRMAKSVTVPASRSRSP